LKFARVPGAFMAVCVMLVAVACGRTMDSASRDPVHIVARPDASGNDPGRRLAAPRPADAAAAPAPRIVATLDATATGCWVESVVASATTESFSHVRLALDARGEAHLAWDFDAVSGTTVGYATRVGGAWVTETVPDCDTALDLAIDAGGRPHVLCTRATKLGDSVRSGGTWQATWFNAFTRTAALRILGDVAQVVYEGSDLSGRWIFHGSYRLSAPDAAAAPTFQAAFPSEDASDDHVTLAVERGPLHVGHSGCFAFASPCSDSYSAYVRRVDGRWIEPWRFRTRAARVWRSSPTVVPRVDGTVDLLYTDHPASNRVDLHHVQEAQGFSDTIVETVPVEHAADGTYVPNMSQPSAARSADGALHVAYAAGALTTTRVRYGVFSEGNWSLSMPTAERLEWAGEVALAIGAGARHIAFHREGPPFALVHLESCAGR
jgi:hypothetical protein